MSISLWGALIRATMAVRTDLMGKLTIVGFFSTKKLFFVNLWRRSKERGQSGTWWVGLTLIQRMR